MTIPEGAATAGLSSHHVSTSEPAEGKGKAAASAQSTQMDAVFKSSIQSQSQQPQFRQGTGEGLILVGTSTAGKSSIIAAYRHLRPYAIEHGGDKTMRAMTMQQFREQYPKEMAQLEAAIKPSEDSVNVLNAICPPPEGHPEKVPIAFKDSVNPEDKIKLEKMARAVFKGATIRFDKDSVNSRMLEDVIAQSIQGKQTIFDVLEIDSLFQQCVNKRFHMPMKVVLVYCPLQVLSERMVGRNTMAMNADNPKPHEKRVGTFPLIQFTELFGPKQNQDDLVLETLHRDAAVAIFQKNFKDEIADERLNPKGFASWMVMLRERHGKDHSDEKLLELETVRFTQEFLEKLGFTSESVKSVELTPRKKNYHYLIDTSEVKASQSAEMLHRGVTGRGTYHFV